MTKEDSHGRVFYNFIILYCLHDIILKKLKLTGRKSQERARDEEPGDKPMIKVLSPCPDYRTSH